MDQDHGFGSRNSGGQCTGRCAVVKRIVLLIALQYKPFGLVFSEFVKRCCHSVVFALLRGGIKIVGMPRIAPEPKCRIVSENVAREREAG